MEAAENDFLDRARRVRMALWVYASISIDKLPAWSNYWHSQPPLVKVFRDAELPRHFQDSLGQFDTKLNDISTAAYQRLKECSDSFSFVDKLQGEPEYNPDEVKLNKMFIEEYKDSIQEILDMAIKSPDKLASTVKEYERHMTGGIWSPTTEEQHREASCRVFRNLVSLYDGPGVMGHMVTIQLATILTTAFNRLGEMALYEGFKPIFPDMGDNLPEKDALDLITEHLCQTSTEPSRFQLESIPVGDEELGQNILHLMRRGKRWKLLKDILGQGVVLVGGGSTLTPRHPLLRLDIPAIVELGTDDEFSQLTEIINTRCSWLKDTCSKLERIVERMKAELASEGALEEPLSPRKEILETVQNVFGEPLQRAQALTMNSSFGGEIVAVALSMLVESLPRRSALNEKSKALWDMLVDSTRESMLNPVEERNGSHSTATQHINVGIRKTLDEVSEKFLEKYRFSMNEEVDSWRYGVGIMRARVVRAMDLFSKSLSHMMSLAESSATEGGATSLTHLEEINFDWAEAFEDIILQD